MTCIKCLYGYHYPPKVQCRCEKLKQWNYEDVGIQTGKHPYFPVDHSCIEWKEKPNSPHPLPWAK